MVGSLSDVEEYGIVECAFGRDFITYLTPKKGILHPHFVSREVKSDGVEHFRKVDPDEHYEGHVFGTNDSAVSITFDDNGTPLGILRIEAEVYVLEPASLHKKELDARDVLVYRTSDMKNRHVLNTPRCSLRVVADYTFFEINVIDRINTLFTAVDWGKDDDGKRLINMGFMIKDMKIHTAISYQPGHYNRHKRGDIIDVNGLLEDFSAAEGRQDFCLVHLFTAHSFPRRVLGLAYISSPGISPVGGICAHEQFWHNDMLYARNTGLSSTRTTEGGVVISREADLVTAHELGHNWGATHDDQHPDCDPPYKKGGSYLMHVYSISGYDENNYKFSPCSRLMISKVLASKSATCFEEETSSFCGNGRIEQNENGVMEECDVGGLLWGEDKCCNANCTLKSGMKCSPKNSPCCSEDCQFLPSNHTCLHENPFQCRGSSFCTGNSGECPEPTPIADGTKCLDEGECRNGTCLSFCEWHEMEPCICADGRLLSELVLLLKKSCYRCCRPRLGSANRTCDVFTDDGKYLLSNGSRCVLGHCTNGICVHEVTDGVSHIWIYLQNYEKGNFCMFRN
uniref:ADAM 17-like protease n=1 Tax=Syphacia muris TaxID=451379 RepID=A0A0N5A8W8_9BILA